MWQVVQASGSFPSPSCPVPEGNCKLLYLRLLITIPFQERRLEGPFIVHCRVVVLTEFGG